MLLSGISIAANAQDFSKKENKYLQKEVKTFLKEGWKLRPSPLPIVDHIKRIKAIKNELDENGNPKWLICRVRYVDSTYDVAKNAAIQQAKIELAQSLVSSDSSKVDNLMKSELFRPKILFEAYRGRLDGNIEVLVQIGIPNQKLVINTSEARDHNNTPISPDKSK